MRILAILLLLLSGCAPLAENDIYDRQDALLLAQEKYIARQSACADSGGVMFITAATASRIKKAYSKQEYDFARCGQLN
jgi:hypothetical protein